MTTTVLPAAPPASARSGSVPSAGYKVDISRGERIGRVSSEWFSRPDDERFLSLGALHTCVRARAERATARTVETKSLRVEASRNDVERLALIVPGQNAPVAPTHWSFGQLCNLVGAPASYMRQLPAPLAGINLQHGLLSHRAELVKTLEADDEGAHVLDDPENRDMHLLEQRLRHYDGVTLRKRQLLSARDD